MTTVKHPALIIATGLLAMSIHSSAQNSLRIPDPYQNLSRAEKNQLTDQATHFFSAAKPAVATAAKSTVAISYRFNRIAYGTVVTAAGSDHPVILTKWSEVVNARTRLIITTPDGKKHPAEVTGVYPKHDLALLSIKTKDAKLTPLDLTASANPELGNFIALPRPDGNVEGFGVVSVKARSLRESDRAYLGVLMDFTDSGKNGIPLKQVMPDSAASKAGLRDGDVIVSIDNSAIAGAMEMRNLLQRLTPGSQINLRYRRGDAEKNTTVHLGSRAENEDIRRVPRQRMERMQRMGAVPSKVRSDFPNVIQTDMPIHPADTGAPVTDLDGRIVGIAIARGSRIKTFVIPTSTIQTVLATKPTSLSAAITENAQSRTPDRRNTARNSTPQIRPSSNDRVPPRAVPAEDDDPMGKVRRLLGEIERNNDENSDNLRKIEDALRALKSQEKQKR